MAGVDLISLRPFRFDALEIPDLRQLRGDDLAAARITRRRQLRQSWQTLGIPACDISSLALATSCGYSRQIDIGRIVRREVAADRRTVAEHRTIDDGAAIQRIGDRSPHQYVMQRPNALIQRQYGLHLRGAGKDAEAGIGGKLGEAFRSRIVGERIDITRHQRRKGGSRIRDEFEGHLLERSCAVLMVGVAFERDRIAAPPSQESKWPRADRRSPAVATDRGESMTADPKASDCSNRLTAG